MSPAERVALVTGAAGGIGAAIVDALVAAGNPVALGARSSIGDATVRAKEIEAAGGRAVAVQLDVTDPASVDRAVGEVEAELGPVTVLVNNAGRTSDGLLMRMSDDQWRTVLAANLDGAFHVTRRVLPAMVRARWGRIVNVSSVVALSGSPGQANYAAAKAGLVGFTRSIAREMASRQVTANVIAPGPIDTAMFADVAESRRAELAATVPLGRTGRPEEVASAVAYLCSNSAAYVTGAVLPVDGGLGLGH